MRENRVFPVPTIQLLSFGVDLLTHLPTFGAIKFACSSVLMSDEPRASARTALAGSSDLEV